MHINFIRRLVACAAAATVAAGAALAAAAPAAAATPRCTYWAAFTYHDFNGDAGIRSKYPSAGAFDYVVWPPTNGGPSTSGTPSCQIGYGTRGEPVEQLQMSLNACYSSSKSFNDYLGRKNLGFAFLTVDGVYGAKTKAAVTAVQRHHKIKIDGSYGPQTALTMKHTAKALEGPYRGNRFCHTIFP